VENLSEWAKKQPDLVPVLLGVAGAVVFALAKIGPKSWKDLKAALKWWTDGRLLLGLALMVAAWNGGPWTLKVILDVAPVFMFLYGLSLILEVANRALGKPKPVGEAGPTKPSSGLAPRPKPEARPSDPTPSVAYPVPAISLEEALRDGRERVPDRDPHLAEIQAKKPPPEKGS
jgi:hypothetical protein